MILIIFFIFIFQNRPFVFNNDQQLTFNIFYTEWLRLLKDFITTGQFPFYSWYKFLGSDFYSSANIYVTGDIFIPLLFLFNNIETGLMIQTILLIYISSYTFHKYLSAFGIQDNRSKTIVSIMYAFTGLAILYFGNYMFHRFYAFMPLMFAGIEDYLKRNKYILFTLSVSLLLITSLYFMFPTSLFLVIYFLFTYFRSNTNLKTKPFLQTTLKLGLLYMIGFFLSAIITLPAIFALINNARIGAPYDPFLTWDLKVSIGFIISHITAPFALFTDIPYMFAAGFNGHAMWYSVYTSTLSLLIFLYYFLFIIDKEKKYFLFLYLSTLFIIFFKPLNSIFHGFSEPTFRFAFLYVFVVLLITAYVLDNFKSLNVYKSYFFYLIIACFSFITLYRLQVFDYRIYTSHINYIYLSLLFGLFACMFFNTKFIYIFILFELTFNATLILYTLNKPFYAYSPNITKEYLDYYTAIDEDIFYRIYINPLHLLPTNNLNLNQSMNLHYRSTSTYDTNYEGELRDFLRLNGFDWHIIHINDPELLQMLGVKYYVVYDETELPSEVSFTYVYDLNFLKVYKDNSFKSVGYTFNNFKYFENVYDGYNVDWMNELLIYAKDAAYFKDIPHTGNRSFFNIASVNNNSLLGSIEAYQPTILFLSIPYNEGWKIIVNGVETSFLKVHGGFLGIPINAGIQNIEMYFMPKGFKLGLGLSSVTLMALIFNQIRNKKALKEIGAV